MNQQDPILTLHNHHFKSNRIKYTHTIGPNRFLVYSIVFVVLSIILYLFTPSIILGNSKAKNRLLQYSDQQLLLKQKYTKQRKQFIKQMNNFNNLKLIESNLEYNQEQDEYLESIQQQQYQKLNQKYIFQDFKKQLPFCIIIQSLNFTIPFIYQFTLNSVFSQNYTNYKAVIFNNGQQGNQKIIQYLKSNKIHKDKYIFIKNKQPKGIIQNILIASQSHCQKNSISFNIVGNNQFIGKNVLKIFNAVYQTNKIGMAYSNFYTYQQGQLVNQGFNIQYAIDDLWKIRSSRFALSSSVTYFTEHLLKINKDDLKDLDGKYLDLAYEQAIFFPLLEVSCRLILKIEGFHLLVSNYVSTYLEFKKSLLAKSQASAIARHKKQYECDLSFKKSLKTKTIIRHKSYLTKQPILKSISTKRVQKGGSIKQQKELKNYQIAQDGNDKLIQYLYKDKKLIQQRQQYERQRLNLIKVFDRQDSKKMIKANLRLGEYIDKLQKQQQDYEIFQAQSIHKIFKYQQQKPFCIYLQYFTLQKIYRFQYTLNSIFNQNYTNYFVIIINKDPKIDQYLRKYLHFYKIQKERYVYIENYQQDSPAQLLYNSITQSCSLDSYSIIMDSSGQLLGKNTLSIFNKYFSEKDYGMMYSNNYIFNQQKASLKYSSTSEYTQRQKQQNLYRRVGNKFGHLIAFKTLLFLNIDVSDFQDINGQFRDGSFTDHIYISLLQLSCKKVSKILGVHYLTNEDLQQSNQRNEISYYIKSKKTYNCLKNEKSKLIVNYKQDKQLNIQEISKKRIQKSGLIQKSSPFKLDLLMKNQQQQTIDRFLYKKPPQIINDRILYHNMRKNYLKKQNNEDSRQMIGFNLKLNKQQQIQQNKIQLQQYSILLKSHPKIQQSKQLPICIIVDRFNFQIPFKFQFTLNSIFLQNYTNYFVAIFNDGSKQGHYLLPKYLHFYKIPLQKYIYHENKQKKSTIQITQYSIQNYCSKDSYAINIAGQDQLLGRNVFKIFNYYRQTTSNLIIYSNLYYHKETQSLDYGKTSNYSDLEKSKNLYRSINLKIDNPIFYSSQLFKKIKATDLKFEGNKYYQYSFEKTVLIPMLELSCGRSTKIVGVHYIYNEARRTVIDKNQKIKQQKKITLNPKYECQKSFQLK